MNVQDGAKLREDLSKIVFSRASRNSSHIYVAVLLWVNDLTLSVLNNFFTSLRRPLLDLIFFKFNLLMAVVVL